jgi:branched-subunit amino acid transport protein
MNVSRILISILIMATVTYLVRMLPLVIVQKKISNRFIKSFLVYVPYAVLAAMTFPGILYSTGNVYSACFGLLTAFVLAYNNQGLLTVALGSTAAVFIAAQIMHLLT